MTVSKTGFIVAFSIKSSLTAINKLFECHYAESHCVECRGAMLATNLKGKTEHFCLFKVFQTNKYKSHKIKVLHICKICIRSSAAILKSGKRKFRKGYRFKWEPHSVGFVYTMMMISKQDIFLCWTEKGGQRAKEWRVRERNRERQRECCCRWVIAWAIKLTVGQIFITASERIILDLIKMNIKIIHNNLDGYYFSRCCAFSSIHQTTDIHHRR
jgi:hypothetical protein